MPNHVSTPSSKTYLQVCEEEVKPRHLDPHGLSSSIWSFLAYSSAFTNATLIAGGFAATCVYAPVFAPVAGFVSLLLYKGASKVHHAFEARSQIASDRAAQITQINRHYQNLTNSTPAQIKHLLRQKDMYCPSGDADLNRAKPLIARCLFWDEQTQMLQKEQNDLIQSANKLAKDRFKANRDTIYAMQSEALEIEKEVLVAKVKNAFNQAVLRNLNYKGTFEALGTISEISGQERALAIQTKAPNAEDFFTFKGPKATVIKYHEAKNYTAGQVALVCMHKNMK